jgi:hypothetical protein
MAYVDFYTLGYRSYEAGKSMYDFPSTLSEYEREEFVAGFRQAQSDYKFDYQ